MHSKFLVVLGLCVTSSILQAADAAVATPGRSPRRHLDFKNDYGRPNKHRHDKGPSSYRRRLEDDTKATESSDYAYGHNDYGHDDYEHKGYGSDDYSYKGYGKDKYGYDSKGYDYKSECNDYSDDYYGPGNNYYGFGEGYGGYYPDYSSYGGYGYGGDYGFYPDYSSYGGIYGYSGYGYPGYGYPDYGFPGFFGYESTAGAEAGTNDVASVAEDDANNKSAEKKATETPSKEAKSKPDAANKSKSK